MGHQSANFILLGYLLVLVNLLITLLPYYSKLYLLLINHVSIKEQFIKHSKAKKFFYLSIIYNIFKIITEFFTQPAYFF